MAEGCRNHALLSSATYAARPTSHAEGWWRFDRVHDLDDRAPADAVLEPHPVERDPRGGAGHGKASLERSGEGRCARELRPAGTHPDRAHRAARLGHGEAAEH